MSDVGASSSVLSARPEVSGVLGFFASNSVAANLLMVLFLVGGLIAGLQLRSELFPTIDRNIIRITVAYPGATPSEVEEGITRRVEEAVSGIDGVERVRSTASENNGVINLELRDFADDEAVRDDVENAMDRITRFPPADAEQPEVESVETVSGVMTLVVTSEGTETDVKRGAELLKDALLTLEEVSLVSLDGVRGYEIAIEVGFQELDQYGLTLGQVAAAIRANSLNLSSGELRTKSGDLLIRTNQKRNWGDEFKDVVVRALPDGSVLKVSDIATVRDGFVEDSLYNEYNGKPAAFVRVFKTDEDNVIDVADAIKAELPNIVMPPNTSVAVLSDETSVLKARQGLMVRNGVLGFSLVVLFLVLMLDLRLAIWVAMGVPISFLGAFLFFDTLGVTVNMVSLFGLILVLGIVVDDAIVVGESIGNEQERGLHGVAASMAGVRRVFAPVLVGVTTTMAAFAPLLFATGMFGQLLGVVPVVVIAVLIISLIEVFLILPAHLSHERKLSHRPLSDVQEYIRKKLTHVRDEWIIPMVSVAIRVRYLSLLAALCFLVLALALLQFGLVRFIFFPTIESDETSVSLGYPVGTPFETTMVAARQVKQAALRVNEESGNTAVKNISMTVGGRAVSEPGPGSEGEIQLMSHVASVNVQLNPEPLRKLSAEEFARQWRQQTGTISGTEYVSFSAGLFDDQNTVEYEMSHEDEVKLQQAVDFAIDGFKNTDGIAEVTDSVNIGKRQFDIELTSAGKAAGFTPEMVARQLRQSFFGEEVHRIQRRHEELNVMVRYPKSERLNASDFYNMRIQLPDGMEVPLSTVAVVNQSRSFSSIDRVDGQRVVIVSGLVDTAVRTPNEVLAHIEENVIGELRERYPHLRVGPTGFSQEQSEDMGSIVQLGMFAMLLIFILLASQLKSYTLPLIVLAAVPFGAAGAVLGHLLLGYTLSFISVFGMIALSGVVVNDSIVLIDLYNRLRQEGGMSPQEAIIEATRGRFRAIFLTTVTTTLGLTPMLFEQSIQAQFIIPMAVSLATGIVFASVVILFLVPCLVMIRFDIGQLLGRLSPNGRNSTSEQALEVSG